MRILTSILRFGVLTGVMVIPTVAPVGCGSGRVVAPRIDEALTSFAASRGVDEQTMRLGRRVYLVDCAGCHSAEPIDQYDEAEWHLILDDMIEQTPSLDAREAAAVRAYVLTTRRSMP